MLPAILAHGVGDSREGVESGALELYVIGQIPALTDAGGGEVYRIARIPRAGHDVVFHTLIIDGRRREGV